MAIDKFTSVTVSASKTSTQERYPTTVNAVAAASSSNHVTIGFDSSAITNLNQLQHAVDAAMMAIRSTNLAKG